MVATIYGMLQNRYTIVFPVTSEGYQFNLTDKSKYFCKVYMRPVCRISFESHVFFIHMLIGSEFLLCLDTEHKN